MPQTKTITFRSRGVELGAVLGLPDAPGQLPLVVMAHGFAGVKELNLPPFAKVFHQAGIATLVFDHPNFGDSGGSVRQEVDPWAQVDAFRDAITCACGRSEIDAARIGIWGSSLAGGHVLVVSAIDSRVRAAVSQVPAASGSATLARRAPPEQRRMLRAAFEQDRLNRGQGLAAQLVQVYPVNPSRPAALLGPNAMWHYEASKAEEKAPTWRNEVTLRSLEAVSEYEPGHYARLIDRTPLMMVTAGLDDVAPVDLASAAFEEIRSEKKLVNLPGSGHFDVYHGVEFARVSSAACDWFMEKL